MWLANSLSPSMIDSFTLSVVCLLGFYPLSAHTSKDQINTRIFLIAFFYFDTLIEPRGLVMSWIQPAAVGESYWSHNRVRKSCDIPFWFFMYVVQFIHDVVNLNLQVITTSESYTFLADDHKKGGRRACKMCFFVGLKHAKYCFHPVRRACDFHGL